MTGLRQRQIEDRRRRVLAVARDMFAKDGFESSTVEELAERAGVSGMTIHNYFSSKAGVLLTLVIDSDRLLAERLEALDVGDDLIEFAVAFTATIVDHALGTLKKEIWRQVIASVTANADSQISKAYFDLDRRLMSILVSKVRILQDREAVPRSVDADMLGTALFHLQNARFIELICSGDLGAEDVVAGYRGDLTALLAARPR